MENRKRTYKIEGYVKTDVGLVRQNNEDNFLLKNQFNEACLEQMEANCTIGANLEWNCFAVFDGIGGAERGELAAKFAAESAKECSENIKACRDYGQIREATQRFFLDANNRIIAAKNVMDVCGTTGTAFVTDGIMAKVFHVGDSRAYLYREGKFYQLTKDQTLAKLKVETGFYSSLKEASVRELHQLTEFIGRDETMQYFKATESDWMDFRIGDQVVLCSDGLYEQCGALKMQSILKQNMTGKEKVEKMIEYVYKKGAQDNITCMLLEKKEVEM